MTGNLSGVGSIVESMHTAENLRMQQNTANTKGSSFSDYLDMALLNNRTGLFTGSGINSCYPWYHTFSDYSWKNTIIKALRDELKKESDEEQKKVQSEGAKESSSVSRKKKPDWAVVRVIERYQPPVVQTTSESEGLLV